MTCFFPQRVCCRLTSKCNLKCSFCLSSSRKEDIPKEILFDRILFLKEHGTKTILLGGGEPTLRKDIIEIIHFCNSIGFSPILCSNLYDIEELLPQFVETDVSFNVSIHGSRHIHNKIVGYHAYDIICHNIQSLIKMGKVVNIHYVITNENVKCIDKVIDKMHLLGVSSIVFHSMVPRGSAKRILKSQELISQYRSLWDECCYIIDKNKEKYIDLNIRMLDLYATNYYVLETDGNLYCEREIENKDEMIVGWK